MIEHQEGAVVDLERKRSLFALERVEAWREDPSDELARNAATLTQGLPVALRSQGLLVVSARLAAKTHTKDAEHQVLAALMDWLGGDECPLDLLQGADSGSKDDYFRALRQMEPSAYRAAQREALHLAERLKLFASALKPPEEEESAHG